MSTPGVAMTFDEMLTVAQPLDFLSLWDKDPVAYVIEAITHGPSHVILLASFAIDPQWYEFEAVFPQGCRLLPLSHYAASKSRMLLCRRKNITAQDQAIAMRQAMGALGRRYEVTEEIEIAIHRILPFLKVQPTDNELFCSGYLQYAFQPTSVPFAPSPQGNNLTPIQCVVDAGTEIVGWVN